MTKEGTIFLSILFQLQSCFKNIELEIPNKKKYMISILDFNIFFSFLPIQVKVSFIISNYKFIKIELLLNVYFWKLVVLSRYRA